MKKELKNVLIRKRKKNGISIWICAVVLTISLGMLTGCSAAKEDPEKGSIGNEDAADGDTENVPEQSEPEEVQTEPLPADDSPADNSALEDTITLTFLKEGEQEQKQATLVIGDGYSLYLPDDEQWHLSAPDLWITDLNEQVTLWVTHFEGESEDTVDQKLEEDGYAEEDSHKWWKQEGDLVYHVEQKVVEDDVWGIFYSYPADFEGGWGREFPVIVNTFALLDGADNGEGKNDAAGTGEYLEAEDCRKIRTVLDAFAEAYFDGDADAIRKLLADTYEGEADLYEGTGVISDLTMKGLSDADEKKMENGKYHVSIEFRDSTYEDMFLYLTVIVVKEEDDWKIQFYGVEG